MIPLFPIVTGLIGGALASTQVQPKTKMKMGGSSTLNIAILESGNTEAPMVGVISAPVNASFEFERKAKQALMEHFDADVIAIKIQDGLDFADVLNRPPLDATVLLDMDGDESEYQIELMQTWIY